MDLSGEQKRADAPRAFLCAALVGIAGLALANRIASGAEPPVEELLDSAFERGGVADHRCPARRKSSWELHGVRCGNYGSDTRSLLARWDAFMSERDLEPTLRDVVREDAPGGPAAIHRRAYRVAGVPLLALFHERGKTVVTAYAMAPSPPPDPDRPEYPSSAHPLRGFAPSGNEPASAGPRGVTDPRRIHYVEPTYPERAKQLKLAAEVVLQALIEKDGSVGDVQVLSCTHPGLGFEEAAVEAIKHWRYEPALFDGKPVAVHFTVVTVFKLG